MTTIAIIYVGFVLLNNVVQSVNGQANPRQFSELQAAIPDVSLWTYGDGLRGPRNWPIIFNQYCSSKYQSPIAIRTRATIYDKTLKEFAIFYDPPLPGSKFQVHNNGHSVNTIGDFYVTNGGLQDLYKTYELHFHWGKHSNRGSEHMIDGKRAPLELHIASYNTKYISADAAAEFPDGLAVLTVLFRLSKKDNPVFDQIVRVLPQVRDPDDHVLVTIPATSIKNLLPNRHDRYFRYYGSKTTPYCRDVIWTLFEQKQYISERQLHYFRQMLTSSINPDTQLVGKGGALKRRIPLVDNFRPIQRHNGRKVYRSFPYFVIKSSKRKYVPIKPKAAPCLKPYSYMKKVHSVKLSAPHYLPLLSKI